MCLVSGLAAKAEAFRRTATDDASGRCVTWADRNFEYRADQEGSARTPGETEFAAIDASFATWQSVSNDCSDFKFTRGQRLAGGRVGKGTEGENLVIFREISCREKVAASDTCLADGSCANLHRCWDLGDDTIGLTTVTYSRRTGIAVDADIELNASAFLFTTVSSPPCESPGQSGQCVAFDVQNTLTHEIGHAVGLDHVDNPGSTMALSAELGETSKRLIDLGTAQGFCLTYPRGQPPVPCDQLAAQSTRIIASTTGSCGACGATSSAGAVQWLVTLLPWLLLARRHRP